MSTALNRMRNGEDRVGDLLRRDVGVREQMRRKGQEPRDHRRDNVAQLREAQRANRERKAREEEARRSARPFKLRQFQNVESRVARQIKEGSSRAGSSVAGDIPRPSRGDSASFSQRPDTSTSRASSVAHREEESHPRTRAPAGESVYAMLDDGNDKYTGNSNNDYGNDDGYDNVDVGGLGDDDFEGGAGQPPSRYEDEIDNHHHYDDDGNDDGDDWDRAPSEYGAGASSVGTRGGSTRVTKPAVPSIRELREREARLESRSSHRGSKDFVRDNYMEAHRSKAPAKASPVVPPLRNPDEHDPHKINPNFGKVPKYVQDRKAMKAAEEASARAAAKAALECPPGMRLLPEEERAETLAVLQETHKRVSSDLNSLPIVLASFKLQRRKAELEKKMDELESAIATFSRAKVYVTLDD